MATLGPSARRYDAQRISSWGSLPWSLIACSSGVVLWMIKPVGDLRLAALGYLLLLFGAVLSGLSTGFWIDRGLLWSWLSTLAVGIVGMIVGLVGNNTPGVFFEAVFFFCLPLVWLPIVAGVSVSALRAILNAIPFATLIIAVLGWAFWLDSTGRFAIPGAYLVDLGQGLGVDSFGYEMRFYPISTLLFVLPFLTVSLMVKNTYTNRKSLIAAFIGYLPALGLVFIVGRRALLISLVISLLLVTICVVRIDPLATVGLRPILLGAIGLLAAVFVASRTGFSLLQMVSSVGEIRDAADVRAASGEELLSSWLDSPVWGNGLGAEVATPRNIDRPWEFELQYHMILNSLGLLGLIVLGISTSVAVIRFIWLIRKHRDRFGFLIAILAGFFAILVANASNPYLHTPGQYWMFFILPMALNCGHRLLETESALQHRSVD